MKKLSATVSQSKGPGEISSLYILNKQDSDENNQLENGFTPVYKILDIWFIYKYIYFFLLSQKSNIRINKTILTRMKVVKNFLDFQNFP